MLAILATVIAGTLLYSFGVRDLVEVLIAAGTGYAAFATYAYLRARMWADDPYVRLHVGAGHGMPVAARIERFAASLLIPAGVAYFIYRVALA